MRARDFELLKEIIGKIDKEDTDILAWVAVGIIAKYFSTSDKQQDKPKESRLAQSNEDLEAELQSYMSDK